MKPAVKILSLLLALCLMLPAVPFAALAEGEEQVLLCQDCQQESCICCNDCDGTTDAHTPGCIQTCLGGEVCVDGIHTSDCPLYVPPCNSSESCPAETHQDVCPKYCDQYDGCVDGTHSSDCRLFVCPECGGKGKTHTDTCPTLCSYQEGCGDGKHGVLCYLYLCETCQQKPCICGAPSAASQKTLSSINLTTQPKTAYICGESLDVTGGRLTLHYDDESSEQIDLTVEMVTGFDSTAAGEITLTVTYEGLTTTYAITVASAPEVCETCHQETCICCGQCDGTTELHAEDCPTQTNTASDENTDTEMYLYTDSFGGEIWTSYEDSVGYDAMFAMKYGNPDNAAITNTVQMSNLTIVNSTATDVITQASAPEGMVHYKLQNVGSADLSIDNGASCFRINVHKFGRDQFMAMGTDGNVLSRLVNVPGTYDLTLGTTSWTKTGWDWTPADDVFTALTDLSQVSVTGTGVTLENGKITIASDASATLTYTVNGEERAFFVSDSSSDPVTLIRYFDNGSQNLSVGSTIRVPQNNGLIPLYVGRGSTPIAYEKLSISDSEIVTLIKNGNTDADNNIMLAPEKQGTVRLYYSPDGSPSDTKQLLLTVIITEPVENGGDNGNQDNNSLESGTMLVDYGGSIINMLHLEPGTPCETMLYVVGTDGNLLELNPDILYATSDLIAIQRVEESSNKVRITVEQGACGWIRYDESAREQLTGTQEFPWFPLDVQAWGVENNSNADRQANLFLCDPDGSNPRSAVTIKPGDEMTVSLRYGGALASLPVTTLFGGSSNPDSVTITKKEDGTFTIKALAEGTAEITHKDAENGSGISINVTSTRAEDKMLFHKKGGFYGVDVVPYLDMQANTMETLQLYFGDAASSVEVTENVTASGNVTIQKNDGGGYDITAGSAGTGLIGYTKDGVVYTMSVWISSGGGGNGGNYEARNAIKIGNTTYATAQLDSESLTITPNMGMDYESGITTRNFSRHVVLAAMGESGDVNAAAYGNISDVSIKFLACVDEHDDVTPTNNATIASRTTPTVPQTNVTTWGAVVQADAQKGFHSLVAISFTLRDGDILRRCTVTANMSYVAKAGNVVIYANDLNTAGELNVVLSSYGAFINWLADCRNQGATVNGTFELGGNIQLVLPAGDFTDGIVVAQMISDVVENSDKTPISHMTITGNSDGTTKMAGMVYKGGIMGISNIEFVANDALTMEYGGESFTCGILADYTYTSANDTAWDTAYADKYCPDNLTTMTECLAHSTAKLNDVSIYSPDLRWSNVEIYNMNFCTFTGYDYGVRASANGMVGGGFGCSFTDCFYGIYADCYGMGVSTGNPHNMDYSNYTFTNNVFAVRLVSLPGETNPYNFRVHDSTFLHNHREFWIRPRGDYYFYRNYYGGHWRDHDHRGHWHHFKNRYDQFMHFDEWDRDYQNHDGHRPGRYYLDGSDEGVRIITTAARIDGYEGKWIYDRDDQHNRFLVGEQNIDIDQNAIDALETDTSVTVVERDNSGTTTEKAVITFRGKGEH